MCIFNRLFVIIRSEIIVQSLGRHSRTHEHMNPVLG